MKGSLLRIEVLIAPIPRRRSDADGGARAGGQGRRLAQGVRRLQLGRQLLDPLQSGLDQLLGWESEAWFQDPISRRWSNFNFETI